VCGPNFTKLDLRGLLLRKGRGGRMRGKGKGERGEEEEGKGDEEDFTSERSPVPNLPLHH